MGIMIYSLLWVMQDVYHQPYHNAYEGKGRDYESGAPPFIEILKPSAPNTDGAHYPYVSALSLNSELFQGLGFRGMEGIETLQLGSLRFLPGFYTFSTNLCVS